MSPTSQRLVSIDVLRGLAVLAVVARHLPFSLRLTPAGGGSGQAGVPALSDAVTRFTHYGEFGVHLFLVISGFCIHMSWARSKDERIRFGAFWKRRLRRLYPPYVVALVCSLLGLYMLFGVVGGGSGSGALGYPSWSLFAVDLGLLLVLAQNLNGAYLRVGNAPFWSLALEEQLYMLYFPMLQMRRRLGWGATLGVVGAVTLLWRGVGASLDAAPGFWFVLGPAHWFSWALGALAVEAHLGRVSLPSWTRSFIGFFVFLTVAVLVHPSRAIDLGIPGARVLDDVLFSAAFFVLINALADWERAGRLGNGAVVRVLAVTGLWSYSIYLTHDPVIAAMKQVGLRLGLGVPGVLVLRFAGAVLAGFVFYRLVESRFLNISRRSRLPEVTPAPLPEPASLPHPPA